MNSLKKLVGIDTPKLMYDKEIIKIGDKAKISIGTYEKRSSVFQDVVLELENKEVFLGRFNKDERMLTVRYKDGKILIGHQNLVKELEEIKITEVSALYEMVDDTFISCTEKEALNMFDSNLDAAYLKNKDALIHRTDIEKKKRLR